MKLSNSQIGFLMELKKKGPNVRLIEFDGSYTIGTITSVTGNEWATVDRGTPSNRGGNVDEYRYTITPLGESKLPAAQDLKDRADDAAGTAGYKIGQFTRTAEYLSQVTMSDASFKTVRDVALVALKEAKDVVRELNRAVAAQELYESNR